nr:MAG TPA: hypothetical protein [Caudoviricetes sp.]
MSFDLFLKKRLKNNSSCACFCKYNRQNEA